MGSRQKESTGYLFIHDLKDGGSGSNGGAAWKKEKRRKTYGKNSRRYGHDLSETGNTCKKEMDKSQPGDVILVQVDNEVATENLRKLAIPRRQIMR